MNSSRLDSKYVHIINKNSRRPQIRDTNSSLGRFGRNKFAKIMKDRILEIFVAETDVTLDRRY